MILLSRQLFSRYNFLIFSSLNLWIFHKHILILKFTLIVKSLLIVIQFFFKLLMFNFLVVGIFLLLTFFFSDLFGFLSFYLSIFICNESCIVRFFLSFKLISFDNSIVKLLLLLFKHRLLVSNLLINLKIIVSSSLFSMFYKSLNFFLLLLNLLLLCSFLSLELFLIIMNLF